MARIGEEVDLTFPVEHLGEGPDALAKVLKGAPLLKRLKEAKRPAVIVGPGVLNRPDRVAVLQQVPLPTLHVKMSSQSVSSTANLRKHVSCGGKHIFKGRCLHKLLVHRNTSNIGVPFATKMHLLRLSTQPSKVTHSERDQHTQQTSQP